MQDRGRGLVLLVYPLPIERKVSGGLDMLCLCNAEQLYSTKVVACMCNVVPYMKMILSGWSVKGQG